MKTAVTYSAKSSKVRHYKHTYYKLKQMIQIVLSGDVKLDVADCEVWGEGVGRGR